MSFIPTHRQKRLTQTHMELDYITRKKCCGVQDDSTLITKGNEELG